MLTLKHLVITECNQSLQYQTECFHKPNATVSHTQHQLSRSEHNNARLILKLQLIVENLSFIFQQMTCVSVLFVKVLETYDYLC